MPVFIVLLAPEEWTWFIPEGWGLSFKNASFSDDHVILCNRFLTSSLLFVSPLGRCRWVWSRKTLLGTLQCATNSRLTLIINHVFSHTLHLVDISVIRAL